MAIKTVYKIITPVISVFIVFVAVVIYGVYASHIYSMQRDTQQMLDTVSRIFEEKISLKIHSMDAALLFIKENKAIKKYWLERDKDKLLELTRHFLIDLKAEQKITHLYFIDKQKKVFLRVHNPGKDGDTIDRHTLLNAEKSQAQSVGLEYGIHHNFTLRNVHPWFVDGELIGYVEIGEEINHLTGSIANMINAELFIAFDKSIYSREKWEEGISLYGHDTDWDMLEHSVVLGKTLPEIPKSMEVHINHDFDEDQYYIFNSEIDHIKYSGGFVPIKDVQNMTVAKLVVLREINAQEESFRKLIIVLLAGGTVAIIAFVMFLFSFINGIHKTLLKNEQSLIDMANIDPLTQISNRRFYYSVYDKLKSDQRSEKYLAVIDIDDFKKINDKYGHTVGDTCLRMISKIITEEIRKDDVFVRMGGDEFILVFVNSSKQGTLEKMELIRRKTSSLVIPVEDSSLFVTISTGITPIKPEDIAADSPVKRADAALYKAKEDGKNCLIYSD